MRVVLVGFFVLAFIVMPSLAFSKSLRGAMLGNTCAGCHGTRGVSANSKIPPLAGQNPAELISVMLAYRDGSRKGTIMNRVAKGYSDDEINAIAEYFGSFRTEK